MGAFRWRLILVVGVTMGLLAAPVFGAGSLGTGATTAQGGEGPSIEQRGSAADSRAPPDTLGPPDWPAEPLDPEAVPGRYEVRNTTEQPYSSIGHIGASGTLVSDYHVLTAAHVVSDDDGTPLPAESLAFTPGLRIVPNGSTQAPYGRANVEDVYVHPEWAGDPPANDLAIVVLDRPVGAIAGSMALPEQALWNAHSHELWQAGYVRNVTGDRLISSRPTPRPSAIGTSDGYHYYCGPLSHGDSGSPIWTEVDGTPTIVSVNSAFDSSSDCRDAAVGIQMDAARTNLVRAWMGLDDRPRAKADLVVATENAGIPWVDARDTVPREPIADRNASVPVGTAVYNNGPAAVGTSASRWNGERATVQFLAVGRVSSSNDSGGDRVVAPLCSSSTAVGAYEAARVACTADGLPEPLEDAESVDVYATVDPADRVDEYESSALAGHEGSRLVGSFPVNASAGASRAPVSPQSS